jgi:hypothetical protein
LAGCLALVAEAPPLADRLRDWGEGFERDLIAALLARLGIVPREPAEDRALATALITALQSRQQPIDRIFFDWRGGCDPGAEAYPHEAFRDLAGQLHGRTSPEAREHPYWSDNGPCSMHIEEVESLWSAISEHDDWVPFEAKIAAVRRMGEAHQGSGNA